MTKTQIDRLGDRLRQGHVSEEDLRLLESYRRSFADAYDWVTQAIRAKLHIETTGRAKTTDSITEQLRRESIRLPQIQDIAGCRVTVPNIREQDSVVSLLQQLFVGAEVVDRRKAPSHGYRAVHVIATVGGKLIEIQVRTARQHQWAELSEKLSDVIDPAIKYGGGDDEDAEDALHNMVTLSRRRHVVDSVGTDLGKFPGTKRCTF